MSTTIDTESSFTLDLGRWGIARYSRVAEQFVPTSLRWDTPARNKGQIVEEQWARKGKPSDESGPGDEWHRIVNHSTNTTQYFRRTK
ncbi:MAG: hypothetical protein R2754_00105 [Microthrixaceae bacterium]